MKAKSPGTVGQPLSIALIVLLFILCLPLAEVASACPACKDAVSQGDVSGLGEGLSYSVIGMAAMPFLLFASIASIVIRSYLKRSREVAAE